MVLQRNHSKWVRTLSEAAGLLLHSRSASRRSTCDFYNKPKWYIKSLGKSLKYKKNMLLWSNAVPNERTVMIHDWHALIAEIAVFRSNWLKNAAFQTQFFILVIFHEHLEITQEHIFLGYHYLILLVSVRYVHLANVLIAELIIWPCCSRYCHWTSTYKLSQRVDSSKVSVSKFLHESRVSPR